MHWRQAVEALPAGQLQHPIGGPQRKVRAAVLGRQQVDGAAKRERLDDLPLGQSVSDLARDGAEPAHDADD